MSTPTPGAVTGLFEPPTGIMVFIGREGLKDCFRYGTPSPRPCSARGGIESRLLSFPMCETILPVILKAQEEMIDNGQGAEEFGIKVEGPLIKRLRARAEIAGATCRKRGVSSILAYPVYLIPGRINDFIRCCLC